MMMMMMMMIVVVNKEGKERGASLVECLAAWMAKEEVDKGRARLEGAVAGIKGNLHVIIFCTDKNRVVKIIRSSSEMVLRTIKHTMIYPCSCPFLNVIALHPAV
jgi:hypothetical protein